MNDKITLNIDECVKKYKEFVKKQEEEKKKNHCCDCAWFDSRSVCYGHGDFRTKCAYYYQVEPWSCDKVFTDSNSNICENFKSNKDYVLKYKVGSNYEIKEREK